MENFLATYLIPTLIISAILFLIIVIRQLIKETGRKIIMPPKRKRVTVGDNVCNAGDGETGLICWRIAHFPTTLTYSYISGFDLQYTTGG